VKLKLGVFVVAALCPVTAFSATDFFVSGDQLYDYCQEKNPSCTSYIAGAVDTLLIMRKLSITPKIVCLPDNAALGQVVDTAVNYLQGHPEERKFNAASTALEALAKTFPCNK
jgi:Rap1a immunity proteins